MHKNTVFAVCWVLMWAFLWFSSQTGSASAGSMDDDLIAHWPMNEGGGCSLRDLSRKQNHGSLALLAWFPGGGVVFDGVKGRHLRFKNIPEYDFGEYGQFSVMVYALPYSSRIGAAVLRVGRSAASERAIIDISDEDTSVGMGWRFLAHDENNNAPKINRIYGGPVTLNEWVHLAMSWDGEKLVGYINGALVGIVPQPSIANDEVGVGVGGEPDTSEGNLTFHGVIRDVRLYRRALGEDEIKSVIDETSPSLLITKNIK